MGKVVGIELLIDEGGSRADGGGGRHRAVDVDNNSGLVIGYEGTSDASSYMISTNVAFVPPSG